MSDIEFIGTVDACSLCGSPFVYHDYSEAQQGIDLSNGELLSTTIWFDDSVYCSDCGSRNDGVQAYLIRCGGRLYGITKIYGGMLSYTLSALAIMEIPYTLSCNELRFDDNGRVERIAEIKLNDVLNAMMNELDSLAQTGQRERAADVALMILSLTGLAGESVRLKENT